MSAVGEKLRQQIGVVTAAIKRPLDGDPHRNQVTLDAFVNFLEMGGVTDIRNLEYFDSPDLQTRFFYDVSTGRVVSGPYPYSNGPKEQNYIFSITVDDRWAMWIYAVLQDTGVYGTVPIFYCVAEDLGTTWAGLRTGIIFIAGSVVSFAFPALGAEIGAAIFAGTAVPVEVATVVGNVAVQSALNGGNVQTAVVNAVSGGIGLEAGGFVADATSAQWIGNAAGAATSAAIRGGDLQTAVAGSLLTSGVTNMSDWFSVNSPVDQNLGAGFVDQPIDLSGQAVDTFNFNAPTDPNYLFSSGQIDPAAMPAPGAGIGDGSYTFGGSVTPGYDGVPNPLNPPVSPSGGSVFGDFNVGAAMNVALQAVRAYKQAGNPAVQRATSTRSANASTGLVNGQKPTVGVPFGTVSGGTVVNNGDGTFTAVSALGVMTQGKYSAGNTSPVILAALGLGALFFLKR